MYSFRFSINTLEKGRINFIVKANDKKTAIDKAFKKIDKMGLSCTPHWNCNLI